MVKPRPGLSGMAIMPSFDLDRLLDEVVDHRIGAERIFEDEARTATPRRDAGRRRSTARRPTDAARSRRLKALARAPMRHRLADAAAEGRGRAGRCRRRLQHGEIAEGEARRLALAGGDRDRCRRRAPRPCPALSSAITGSSNQARSQSRDQLDEALGLGDRVGAVRVDHDVDIGPERLARGLDARGRDMRRRRPWRRPASSPP